MDLSFSILVDINRLVRIVQFMHTVFRVRVPEAILFYLFINFYGDNYILSAVYLLVLMNLNILINLLKFTRCYHLPFLNTSYRYPYYWNKIISLKILPKFTKWTLALCHILPSLSEFSIKGLQIYCRPCRPVAYQILVCGAHCHMLSLWLLCNGDKRDIMSDISHNRIYAKFTWLFYVYHLSRNYW